MSPLVSYHVTLEVLYIRWIASYEKAVRFRPVSGSHPHAVRVASLARYLYVRCDTPLVTAGNYRERFLI